MEEPSRRASTEETRQKFKAYHPNEWTEEDQKRVDEQYLLVKQELGRLVAQGADPASPEAQNVARIKQELGFGFSQGDPDIEASVGKWWEEFHALPQEQKPFDPSVYTYTWGGTGLTREGAHHLSAASGTLKERIWKAS
jgi:hypothetical protein